MDHPTDDRRWTARRKFWFPSGILVDRRTGMERRSGAERRISRSGPPASLSVDRRALDDRREAGRRSHERRRGPRRPSDRASET